MSEDISNRISIEQYVLIMRQRIENRSIHNSSSCDGERQRGRIIASSQCILDDGTVINTYKDVTSERTTHTEPSA